MEMRKETGWFREGDRGISFSYTDKTFYYAINAFYLYTQ